MDAALHTARLILRPPAAGDIGRFFSIHSDPATNLFNPAGPMRSAATAAASLAAWCEHWRLHGYGQWAISTVEAPDHVIGFGGIALRAYLDSERVNLGYRFDAACWGQGYASEVAFAARDLAMATLGLARIDGLVRPRHGASIRVLEKIGMERDGLLDDTPGQPPSLVYAMTQTRFRALAGGG